MNHNEETRNGLTLIEVLVVFSILALLASLMLPGVRNARSAARRAQCLNNMRNVGTAMQTYATVNHGRLPPLTTSELSLGQGLGSRPVSWPILIHPYTECCSLFEEIQSVDTQTEANRLASRSIDSWTCPDDPLEEASGRLSFVVNAGFISESRWGEVDNTSHAVDAYDYSFDGTGTITSADQDVTFATGVFWRADPSTPPTLRITLSDISLADGTSQTLLLSENFDTRPFDSVTQTGGWSSSATGDLAFGIPVTEAGHPSIVADSTIEGGIGVAGTADQPFPSTALVLSPPTLRTAQGSINASLGKATPGAAPRPSSLHPLMVNAIMCDGSGRALSKAIAPGVYRRLVTHNGMKFGQDKLRSTDY